MKKDIENLIGNTPLVKIRSIQKSSVFVKLEYMNIGGSIKSRVAYAMLRDLSKKTSLKGKTVLEASGGNTAIGLATFANIFGFQLKLVIPDNFPSNKIQQLKLYGADVILSDHRIGRHSHVLKAREISEKNKELLYTDQFSNYSNVKTHYHNTAGEIIDKLEKVDYFLTGIGSGGTITGVGKRLKEEFGTKIIGVLPKGYDIEKEIYIEHNLPGIGIGMKADILDLGLIDEYIYIDDNEVKEALKHILKEEGLFVGVTALANMAAAKKLAESVHEDSVIVTIAQDAGDSYIDMYKEF